MGKPGENYVLRLIGAQAYVLRMNVLDVCPGNAAADTIALVSWAYTPTETSTNVSMAGFSVLGIDLKGALRWQVSRTLCTNEVIECGQYEIDGHLARTHDGVIVAGNGTHISGARNPLTFAMRIKEGGTILWANTYVPTVPTVPGERIASICPFGIPDHYLIAANLLGREETWLYVIDAFGIVRFAAIAPFLQTRRLRALPSQGICAVGENIQVAHGLVLNIDPVKFTPRWIRSYRTMEDAWMRSIRWFDIAEGDTSLFVIGNFMTNVTEQWPAMAFLQNDKAPAADIGKVIQAFRPTLGDKPVRMRSVAGFIEEVIPIAPSGRKAHFAVTGEADQQPWQFLIQEDGTVDWQKRYRTTTGHQGMLGPTAWPAFHHIVAGGSVRMTTRSKAFLTSSPATPLPDPEAPNCSAAQDVIFKKQETEDRGGVYGFESFGIRERPVHHAAGPDLKIERACLDSPSPWK